jgi:Zn-dependent M28 family amino/carboxypeptidase
VRPRAAVLALTALAVAGCGGAKARPNAAASPTATPTRTATPVQQETGAAVTARGLDEHLDALQRIADDHDGTRAAGTPGEAATVEHLAAVLRDAGWRVTTPSFRQTVFAETRPPRLTVDGRRIAGRHVRTLAYSPGGTATARVRPIDLRLGRPSDSGCRRADFADLRRGEVALVQRGTCYLAEKARRAARAGAAAVLIANDGTQGNTGTFPGTLIRPGVPVPVLAVDPATAARLPGRRVTVRVHAVSERATLRNVLAESPAAEDADRVVMAGAHLDSVAAGPGINDDASGVAALLEAAEALADEPVRLGFWNAEELGLHGSRRYVRGLSGSARAKVIAYVNLDMVGTPGAEARPRAYGTDAVVRALSSAAGGLDRTSIGGSSDHAPFDDAGIPIGGLYTGSHRCYHRACDTAARVNRPLALRMARTATAALRRLAADAR